MLQMAQIILFIASVALDSLHISADRQSGTVQQIFCKCPVLNEDAAGGWRCFSEPQMM